MRALTLTQPWCGLVASGIKLIENRPRSMIRREDFGVPFALHASRQIDGDVYSRIFEIAPELDEGGDEHGAPWHILSRVTSAVIGVATIERVVRVDDGVLVGVPVQQGGHRGPGRPAALVLRPRRLRAA